MTDVAQRQLAAIVKGWQLELAERARDGDPYNEGYMDALDRCVRALMLVEFGPGARETTEENDG